MAQVCTVTRNDKRLVEARRKLGDEDYENDMRAQFP
jgi:hypothetical protein